MKQIISFSLYVLPFCSFSQTTQVSVRAFSEGFYRNATNTMVAVVDPIDFPLICDTVLFALLDPLTTSTVYCTKVLVGTDGYGNVDVPQSLSGQMLIPYVRFRNTLGIYSRNEVLIQPDSNGFDLTDINFATPNCNQDYNVAKAFSGDMNSDGVIDPGDFVPYDLDNTIGAYGYLTTDLNGDGFVDAFDFPLFDQNNALGVFDPYWFTCTYSNVPHLEKADDQLRIYPNPVVTSFVIESNFQIGDLIIYNINGGNEKCIIKSIGTKMVVDVSNISTGIYVLKNLASKQTTYFIKQ